MSTTAVVASSSPSSSPPGSGNNSNNSRGRTSTSMSSAQNDLSPSISSSINRENGERSVKTGSLALNNNINNDNIAGNMETLNNDTTNVQHPTPLVIVSSSAHVASSGEAAEAGDRGDRLDQHHPEDAERTLPAIAQGQTATAAAADQQQHQQDAPLPPDLRRILVEVAQTGISSSLSWNGRGPASASVASPRNKSSSSSSSPYTGGKHSRSSLSGRPSTQKQHRPRPLHTTLSAAAHPPRKKPRNGMHGVRQKQPLSTSKRSSHKRPLLLIRTQNNNSIINNNNSSNSNSTSAATADGAGTTTASGTTVTEQQQQQQQHFSPSSSGRASGSEPEDSYSQDDSEGTTTTINSEMSFEHSRRGSSLRAGSGGREKNSVRGGGGGGVGGAVDYGADGSPEQLEGASEESAIEDSRLAGQQDVDCDDVDAGDVRNQSSEERCVKKASRRTPTYPSLKEAFRTALSLVLDHWFQNRGGYKLSPAEIRRTAAVAIHASQQSSSQPTIAAASASASAQSYQSNNSQAAAKMKYEGSNENEHRRVVNGNAPHKMATATGARSNKNERTEQASSIAEEVFRQRRHLLLNMLCKPTAQPQAARQHLQAVEEGVKMSFVQQIQQPLSFEQQQHTLLQLQNETHDDDDDVGPPFTIQRIAEVLITPERYYTQTHKLCNCLEKLLLVKSPTTAFGGSRGGDTSQSRREERELAALADERGRLKYEYRNRRLKRRASSFSDGENPTKNNSGETTNATASSKHGHSTGRGRQHQESPRMVISENKANGNGDVEMGDADESERDHVMTDTVAPLESAEGDDTIIADSTTSDEQKRELLEREARASLRLKFDHVGIDPHSSSAVAHRDVRSIVESRGLTNSPPPPSLSVLAAEAAHGGLLRQHGHGNSPEQHPMTIVRPLSPILFNSVGGHGGEVSSPNGSPSQHHLHHHLAGPNVHLLQIHHAAAAAGISPFDLIHLGSGGASAGSNSSVAASAAPYANGVGGVSGLSGSTAAAIAIASGLKESDLESRSSASSDLDSESDDVSFDDSASDRSDGSDSGYYESSFSAAARAMAQSRMQQQQRLQQSRLLTSLGSSSHYLQQQQQQPHQPQASQTGVTSGGDAATAPDGAAAHSSELQSGDFMDSFRADDSGGSDSSSSDVAD